MLRGGLVVFSRWAVATAVLSACFSHNGRAVFAAERLNVLFIIADDLNTEIGCYGSSTARTPNLDRLARSAIRFEHAYCQQALCNPSRASLFTGLRPDTLGIWDLTTHFRDVRPELVTLPQWFKQHGYFAQGIGKIYHNWGSQSIHGDPQSWSVPQTMHWAAHWQDWYLPGQPIGTLAPRKAEATQCVSVPDETYFDGRICNLAINTLRKNCDRPFFLAVGFWKPHLPFNAPKKYWDQFDRESIPEANPLQPPRDVPAIALHNYKELRGYTDMPKEGAPSDEQRRRLRHGYQAAVTYLDTQIGKLLSELDSLQLADHTIVVITSDHGFHLGEHSLWCKTSNFERDAHVPLLIRAPGMSAVGTRSDALVELVDLYPTLCGLAGLPIPTGLDGFDISAAFEGRDVEVRPTALTQHPRPPYFKDAPQVMGYSIRTQRYRYTEWRDQHTGAVEARELYDEDNDPHETVNIANQREQQAVCQSHAALLEQVIQ